MSRRKGKGSVHPVTLRGGAILCMLVLPGPLGAQTADRLEGFYRDVRLSPAEVATAKAGSPVVREMTARDKNEVALIGVVYSASPFGRVLSEMRATERWLAATASRTSSGTFGVPATAKDASRLRIAKSDVEAFRKCKPGDCDIKLPDSSIREFKESVDWSGPGAPANIERIVQERLARYANDYRRDGVRSLVEYADKPARTPSADIFERLLADSPYFYEYVPGLQDHMRFYPDRRAPSARDYLLWAVDEVPSLRPVTTLTHATYYETPSGVLALIGEKQLYASHYFDGAFYLTTALENPAGTGSILILIRRMHFDNLPSGGLLNIRGKLVGKLKDAMKQEMLQRSTGTLRP